MEAMKQFKRQQDKFKAEQKKNMKGRYRFRDDDPTEKVDLTKFSQQIAQGYSLADNVTFTMKPLREMIKAKSQGNQTIPFLCSLKAKDAVVPDNVQQQKQDRAPIDLICVLDISGSMAGSKMALLIETVNFIVDTLSEKDRISIVQFNHRARRLMPLKRLTQQNQPQIFDTIENIKATGGTNIAAAMDVTLAILSQRRFKNPVTSVLLLSDGLDEGAQERCQNLLEQYAIQDSFTINTFGYGSDHDAELMDDIAKFKDGTFYYIEKVDDVGECFADCVGGLISVIAKDGLISVLAQNPAQLPPNTVRIKKAFGGKDLWQENQELGVFNTKITHLMSGANRDFVLELELGPSQALQDFEKNMSVARGKCTMIGVNGEQFISEQQMKITLLNPDEEEKEQEDSKDVALQYFRVKAAEVMDNAEQLA